MSSGIPVGPACGGAGAPSVLEVSSFNPMMHRQILAGRLSALAAQFRASKKWFGSDKKSEILEGAAARLRSPESLL